MTWTHTPDSGSSKELSGRYRTLQFTFTSLGRMVGKIQKNLVEQASSRETRMKEGSLRKDFYFGMTPPTPPTFIPSLQPFDALPKEPKASRGLLGSRGAPLGPA